ncbi:hypothetical protein STEG23_010237 [Scotinomys teguina]
MRTSRGGSSSSLHHADITRITQTSRAAALRHHAAAAHSSALHTGSSLCTAGCQASSECVPSSRAPLLHLIMKTFSLSDKGRNRGWCSNSADLFGGPENLLPQITPKDDDDDDDALDAWTTLSTTLHPA